MKQAQIMQFQYISQRITFIVNIQILGSFFVVVRRCVSFNF